MKKGLISLIIFALIFVFIIWIFGSENLSDREGAEDSLQVLLKNAFDEVKDSLKDMTEGMKKLKEKDVPKLLEDTPKILNSEETLRLKEKVLEYEKKYQENTTE